MPFALIDGTRVCQIEEAVKKQPPFTVAAPLQWVQCGDDITTDHVFDGKSFDLQPFLTGLWVGVRLVRDQALAACDWTQVSDAPLNDEARAAWKTYRQSLRDLPASADDPRNVKWPALPA